MAQDDVTDDVTAADYSAVEQEFARTSDDYEEGEDRGYGYQSYGGSYGGSYSNPGYGGYDYGGYGNSGYYGSKSQNSQSGGVGSTVKGNNLVMSTSNALPSASNAANGRADRPLGNGRICWECNERNYGDCLASTTSFGDTNNHGSVYCQGEEYFCYIHERRIIRNKWNDEAFWEEQPWSVGTGIPTYQEDAQAYSNSNKAADTYIRVQMGCQQPQACLRQEYQNFAIDMGKTWYDQSSPQPSNGVEKFPIGHTHNVREGLCRLGNDWQEYADGTPRNGVDSWYDHYWRHNNHPVDHHYGHDRRYGAVEHHYHYGKGTESVCHYCCDALREANYDASNGFYGVRGCNYDAANGAVDGTMQDNNQSSSSKVDGVATDLSTNIFYVRHQKWAKNTFYDSNQYHGMFRNPHTQFPRYPISSITGGTTTPNVNTRR